MKCWTCSRVTVVGPSSMPSTTSRTHAPAATTATRACHSSSAARTRTPSPEASTVNDAGPTPKRTSAPCAAARSWSDGDRGRGEAAAGLGVEQDELVEAHAGPAVDGGRRSEHLAGHPLADERGGDRLHHRGGAVVDPPGQLEQGAAGVGLELPPERQGLLRHAHVVGVVVGVPEDASGAVRAAAVVAGLEPLEQHHVMAAPGEPPRGGRAHGPGSDDDDVGAHAQTGGSGSYWM